MAAMPTRLMPCMPPHCVLAPLVCCRRGRVRGAPQGTAVPCRRACQLAGLRCRSRRLGGWGAWVLRPAQPLPAGLPMCPHLRSIRTTTLCYPSTSAGGWGSVSGAALPAPFELPLQLPHWQAALPQHALLAASFATAPPTPYTCLAGWRAGWLQVCRHCGQRGGVNPPGPLWQPLPAANRVLPPAGRCVCGCVAACLPAWHDALQLLCASICLPAGLPDAEVRQFGGHSSCLCLLACLPCPCLPAAAAKHQQEEDEGRAEPFLLFPEVARQAAAAQRAVYPAPAGGQMEYRPPPFPLRACL